jgi:hypothetical protein
MSSYCERCRLDLFGYPKIKIDYKIYCYRCSRAVVREIRKDKLRDFKTSKVYKDFIENKYKYERDLKIWEDKFKKAKNKYDALIMYLVGFPVLVIFFKGAWKRGEVEITGDRTIDLILIISYLVIATIILLTKIVKNENHFVSSNPKPTLNFKEPIPDQKVKSGLLPNDGSQVNPEECPIILFERDDYTCQECGVKKERRELSLFQIAKNAGNNPFDPTTQITVCDNCFQDLRHSGQIQLISKLISKREVI